jgi:hypothetical protein
MIIAFMGDKRILIIFLGGTTKGDGIVPKPALIILWWLWDKKAGFVDMRSRRVWIASLNADRMHGRTCGAHGGKNQGRR